jgi:hypothetical protein
MLALLYLGLVFSSPSPDRYFIDLSLGSWKQIGGDFRLEFLGDGSAQVYEGAWTVLPQVSQIEPQPKFVLPAPIWQNHQWNWKGVLTREADWEWQLLRDTLELPAHWFGGKRRVKWIFVQFRSPHFLVPPTPAANLVAANQTAWKKELPLALATKNPKKICKCLAKIDFPDKELTQHLKEKADYWKCLPPHARLRMALLLAYSNTQIQALLKK